MSIGNIVGSASFQLLTGKRGFTLGLQDAQRDAQGAVSNIANTLNGLGRAASQAGLAFTGGLTVPIIGFTKSVFDIGRSFESAFAGVAKTFPGTNAQLSEFRDTIRDMANEMPAAREEIAGVAEVAGQLGISAGGLEDFTRTMVQLGETTNLSAEQAATSLARLANILQTDEADFSRLGATVVDLGNNFATTEAEIVNMATRIAGAGQVVGLTESQVLSLATALSSVGVRIEAGGSAISRVFITMANAVEQGSGDIELFAQVAGTSVQGFADAFENDATQALSLFLGGLRDLQQEGGNVFTTLDDLELGEIRVRDALLRLAGAQDLMNDALATGDSAWQENTALVEEYGKRVETIDSQIQILKNQFSDIAVTIFDAFRPQILAGIQRFGEIIGRITSAVEGFASSLDSETKQFLVTIVGLTAAIGPAILAIGGIGLALSAIANPFTIILAAISLLVVAFVAIDQNTEFFESRWPGIIETVDGLKEAFGDLKQAFMDLIFAFDQDSELEGFQNLSGETIGLQEVLIATGRTLGAFFQLFAAGIEAGINGIILWIDAWKLLFELLDPRNLKVNVNPFSDDFGISSGDISGAFEDFKGAAIELGTDLADGIAGGFDTYWNGFGSEQVQDTVEQTFQGFTLDSFREAFSETANGAIDDFAHMRSQVSADLIGLGEVGARSLIPSLHATQNESELTRVLWDAMVDGIISGSDLMVRSTTEVIDNWQFLEANTMPEAAASIDEVVESALSAQDAMVGWGLATDILRGQISGAQAATGIWEGDLANIESAMEILKERIEETGDPTGKFTDQLDFLANKAAPRVEGGIKTMEEAFVDSIVVFEEFRLKQDELNKQLEKGKLSPEGYALAQEEMTRKLIAAEDPQLAMIGLQRELAQAFSDVVTEIEDLLIQLGIIPPRVESELDIQVSQDRADQVESITEDVQEIDGKKFGAEVDIDTLDSADRIGVIKGDIETFDGSRAEAQLDAQTTNADAKINASILLAENFDDLDPEAGLFTDATQFNSTIAKSFDELDEFASTNAEAMASLDRADAIEGLDEVITKANEIDNRILNMRAAFDGQAAIDAAIETANIVAGYTVAQSPTELGPLSVVPDWSFLFEGLPEVAKMFTDETIQHLQSFVNLASSVLDTFGKALEFSSDAGGFSGRLPSIGFIRELAAFTASITAEVGVLAEQFKGDFLTAANNFNQSASSSLSTLNQAIDLVSSLVELGGFRVGQLQLDQISDLKVLVEHIVTSIGDTAALMLGERGLSFVSIANVFAESAQSSLALIKPAVDALKAISELGGRSITQDDLDAASAIKVFIEHLVGSIGDSAAYLLGERGLSATGSFFSDAEVFANAGVAALELVSGITDALEAISGTRAITQDDFDVVSRIKFFVEHLVASFGDSARFLEDSRGAGFVSGAEAFGASVSASIEAISGVLDFLVTLSNLSEDSFQEITNLEGIVTGLSESALDIARIFDGVASTFTETIEGSIERFSGAVENSVSALSAALGFIVDLSENAEKITVGSDATHAYAAALAGIALDLAELFDEVAKRFEETIEGSIERLASAVGNSTSALGATLGFLVDLSENLGNITVSSDDVRRFARELADRAIEIAEEFNRAAQEWDGKVHPQTQVLTDAISASLGAIGSTLGFLGSLTDALAREERIDFGANIRAIASLLAQRGREAAEAFIDVVQTWEVEADVKTRVEDAAKVIQDSFGALNAVISFMNEVTSDDFQIRGGQLRQAARRIAELGVNVGNIFAETGGSLSEGSKAGLLAYANWFGNIQAIFDFLADISSKAPDAVQNAYTFQEAAREIALAIQTGTDALLSIGQLSDLSFGGGFQGATNNVNVNEQIPFAGDAAAGVSKEITVNLDIDGETFQTFVIDTVNETVEELF